MGMAKVLTFPISLSSSHPDAKTMGSGSVSRRNVRTAPTTAAATTTTTATNNPCLGTTFLNRFLDFPLLSSENAQNYVQERNELFSLLRSFASTSTNGVPVHLLLFPEGCPEGDDRRAMIADRS